MTQKLEFSKFLGQETEDEITQVSTYATFQIRLTTISTNLRLAMSSLTNPQLTYAINLTCNYFLINLRSLILGVVYVLSNIKNFF